LAAPYGELNSSGQSASYLDPCFNHVIRSEALADQLHYPSTIAFGSPRATAALSYGTNNIRDSTLSTTFHGCDQKPAWHQGYNKEAPAASSEMSDRWKDQCLSSTTQRSKRPRSTCLVCKKTFSRVSDLRRHANKHDPESRKHFCHVEGCKYSGSYREDKIISHMKNCHPEFLVNGKVVPWRSCVIRGCTYEGHYTKEVWDAHQMGFHSEAFTNGEVIPWKDCTIEICNYNGHYKQYVWDAHYREDHPGSLQNGKLVGHQRCLVYHCTHAGRHNEDEWNAHYKEHYTNSIADGKIFSWQRCPEAGCPYSGCHNRDAWATHFEDRHPLAHQSLE